MTKTKMKPLQITKFSSMTDQVKSLTIPGKHFNTNYLGYM